MNRPNAISSERSQADTITALQEAGLSDVDLPTVESLADSIDENQPLSIAQFGREVADRVAQHSDELLHQVESSELEEIGNKLSEVVSAAKYLNGNSLTRRCSKLPIIGPIIDRLRSNSEQFVEQFRTTGAQINTLLGEVSGCQDRLSSRVVALEGMYTSVRDEYHCLGLHIAAGNVKLERLAEAIEKLRQQQNTDSSIQTVSDTERFVAQLDKRVGDLRALQHCSLQAMPMIRMIQANHRMLIEKFHAIRELTIPAWKRMFILAQTLNEQHNAVDLTANIDAATNLFLRRNAELLRSNSVATAQANQRPIIDIATLENVQASLLETVQAVIRVQQEGIAARKTTQVRLAGLRKDWTSRQTVSALTLQRPEPRARDQVSLPL